MMKEMELSTPQVGAMSRGRTCEGGRTAQPAAWRPCAAGCVSESAMQHASGMTIRLLTEEPRLMSAIARDAPCLRWTTTPRSRRPKAASITSALGTTQREPCRLSAVREEMSLPEP